MGMNSERVERYALDSAPSSAARPMNLAIAAVRSGSGISSSRVLTSHAWTSLDRRDGRRERVIGLIDQPIASVHPKELKFYLETLARECDRLEYTLTGVDMR